jgi:hypothetical protein
MTLPTSAQRALGFSVADRQRVGFTWSSTILLATAVVAVLLLRRLSPAMSTSAAPAVDMGPAPLCPAR